MEGSLIKTYIIAKQRRYIIGDCTSFDGVANRRFGIKMIVVNINICDSHYFYSYLFYKNVRILNSVVGTCEIFDFEMSNS